MTTLSRQKRGRPFGGGLIPPWSQKTRGRAEGVSEKGRFYRPFNTANAEALAWSQSEYFVRNITFYRADAAARSKPDAGPKRPDPAPPKQEAVN
jgi:hypothetical protein